MSSWLVREDIVMNHVLRVALFSRTNREGDVGFVEFTTLAVEKEGDYYCCPAACLSLEEAQQLATRLSRSPQPTSGTIGSYIWLTL